MLDEAGITLNKNTDPRRPASPVRHERRAHRHAVGHHPGHERAGDGARSPSSSPGRCATATTPRSWRRVRDEVAALCGEVPALPRARRPRPLARLGLGWPSMPAWAPTSSSVASPPSSRSLPRRSSRRFADHGRRWSYAPDERRVHTRPTPTLGGVAMFLGVPRSAWAVAWRLDAFRRVFARQLRAARGRARRATIIFVVGLVDDLREVSAPAKVDGHGAGRRRARRCFGVTMFYFRIPFLAARARCRPTGSPLVTVLWVLGMANAINLIDGLDGLAAGIVAIAAGAFFLYSQRARRRRPARRGRTSGRWSRSSLLGMCVGFLPHNFNPARIFMGDSGALLLGLLMAASTSVVGGRADPNQEFSGQTYFFLAPLFIPLSSSACRSSTRCSRSSAGPTRRAGVRGRRQGPPAPPADAPRPRPAAQRADPVGVDRAPVGLRALPDLHRGGRRHRAARRRRARPRALHAVPPRSAPGQGRLNGPRLACAGPGCAPPRPR